MKNGAIVLNSMTNSSCTEHDTSWLLQYMYYPLVHHPLLLHCVRLVPISHQTLLRFAREHRFFVSWRLRLVSSPALIYWPILSARDANQPANQHASSCHASISPHVVRPIILTSTLHVVLSTWYTRWKRDSFFSRRLFQILLTLLFVSCFLFQRVCTALDSSRPHPSTGYLYASLL